MTVRPEFNVSRGEMGGVVCSEGPASVEVGEVPFDDEIKALRYAIAVNGDIIKSATGERRWQKKRLRNLERRKEK